MSHSMASRLTSMRLTSRTTSSGIAALRPRAGVVNILPAAVPEVIPLVKIDARTYASIRAAIPKKFWGALDTSRITNHVLDSFNKERPNTLRFENADYLAVLESLSNLSPSNGADWPLRIKEAHRPPKELLNDLGCAITEMQYRAGSTMGSPLSHACFAGASSLGCEASCVSIVSLISFADVETRKFLETPLYRPIMAQFRNIASKGDNAYALTVQGQNLLQDSKPTAAIRILERALEKGGPEFPWQGLVHRILGQCHIAINDKEGARGYLEKAVDAGAQEAYLPLVKLLKGEDLAQREDLLYKAGFLGHAESFRELASALRAGSNESGQSKDDKPFSMKIEKEFMRLGDPNAAY